MSSVATRLKPRRPEPAPAAPRPTRPAALPPPRVAPAAALTAAIGAALAAIAFVADGGQRLEPTAWTQIALVLGGSALAAAALALGRGRLAAPAVAALAAFAALAALTLASVAWSVQPSDSWVEGNRTVSYLAVFIAGVALARLLPGRWASLLGGLAVAALVVAGWALLTKVFPEWLAPNEQYARLRPPYGYWNAVGLTAALGVPPFLWLAARRHGHAVVNALAWPALGLLLVVVMLSYSRGAIVALGAGLAFWFAFVPLRLRGALALAGSALAAGGVVAWAFAQEALTRDRLILLVREDAGHELGVLLALMATLLLGAGLAAGFLLAYRPPTPRARRRVGAGLLGLVGAVPIAGLVALALAPGGISGQVSSTWKSLTDPQAGTPSNTPERLTATASVRSRYWREAIDVWQDRPLLGAGAGGYATARAQHRISPLAVRHAHGYAVQTLADLGLIGLAVSLAALGAWALAALAAVGAARWRRRRPPEFERIGLLTLVAVVVVFGVHSLVDWTWYVPGTAVAAVLAAGWVAGRAAPARRTPPPEQVTEPLPLIAPARRARIKLTTLPRPAPGPAAAALAALALGVGAAWSALQPVRSVNAGDAALTRLARGEVQAAREIAGIAAERNPLSVEPWFELATIEDSAGRRTAAVEALRRAVALQPANPETWRRLGRYLLVQQGQPDRALPAFRAALNLDPLSPISRSDYLEAARAAAATSG